jgi:hypothetical protein
MDIEIFLDCEEARPEDMTKIAQSFKRWYDDGAEVRPNKTSFASMSPLDRPNHYLVDLGYADPILSFRNLHARLCNLGVKVFCHFTY